MEWPLLFASFIALMLLKCAILHYTMRLANWYKNRGEKPKRKYKDIYDYDFMDDYESGQDEEASKNDIEPLELQSKKSAGSAEGGNDFQRESELQNAAKKLLSSIRKRREQTAAALLNVSQMAPGDKLPGRSGYDPKEFLRASKYYEYLKDHLGKDKNWENKKKS